MAEITVTIEQVGADPVVIEAPVLVLTGQPGSGSGGYFAFEQTIPALSWTVPHNLGFYPAVTIVDDAGHVVIADVQHTDNDTVVVHFSQPQTGKVYCS